MHVTLSLVEGLTGDLVRKMWKIDQFPKGSLWLENVVLLLLFIYKPIEPWTRLMGSGAALFRIRTILIGVISNKVIVGSLEISKKVIIYRGILHSINLHYSENGFTIYQFQLYI